MWLILVFLQVYYYIFSRWWQNRDHRNTHENMPDCISIDRVSVSIQAATMMTMTSETYRHTARQTDRHIGTHADRQTDNSNIKHRLITNSDGRLWFVMAWAKLSYCTRRYDSATCPCSDILLRHIAKSYLLLAAHSWIIPSSCSVT